MIAQQFVHDPVLLILLIASLISWMIIIDRVLYLKRTSRADTAFQQGTPSHDSVLADLHDEFTRERNANRADLLTIMDTVVVLQRQRLERSLPLLGVIGNTAPFVGLLGTVIGIIQAFQSIQTHNNMSPAVVSGGIATALIATATGLAVAIPAVAAHHLLMAAIAKRVAYWESVIAHWLPDARREERTHESLPLV